MVAKIVKEDESVHEGYLSVHRKWRDGKGKNWFYPAADSAHVRLFWDKEGMPCLEYSDGGGKTYSMVKAGRKLEHYAYGMEQLEDKIGEDFNKNEVNKIFVAMRNWPKSRPSKPFRRWTTDDESETSMGSEGLV
jgi:hypothetical protein